MRGSYRGVKGGHTHSLFEGDPTGDGAHKGAHGLLGALGLMCESCTYLYLFIYLFMGGGSYSQLHDSLRTKIQDTTLHFPGP